MLACPDKNGTGGSVEYEDHTDNISTTVHSGDKTWSSGQALSLLIGMTAPALFGAYMAYGNRETTVLIGIGMLLLGVVAIFLMLLVGAMREFTDF